MGRFLKYFLRFLQSRVFFLGIIFLIQLAVVVALITVLTQIGPVVAISFYAFSVAVVIWILSQFHMHPLYKLTWALIVLGIPLFGGICYILFGRIDPSERRYKKRVEPYLEPPEVLPQDYRALEKLEAYSHKAALQTRYVRQASKEPVYQNTKVTYFSEGSDFFQQFLKDLKQAKRYIFLEFFIVEHGEMLDTLLNVLEERAQSGVEVRFMYDDVGSAMRVHRTFPDQLLKRGITCMAFNSRGMKIPFILNNRDHRKIAVIDGSLAYTGGMNIADEYINVISPLGHWKDAMIRLEGDAAWSLAMMFIQLWDFSSQCREDSLASYLPCLVGAHNPAYLPKHLLCDPEAPRVETDEPPAVAAHQVQGFVMPYANSTPLTGEPVAKNIYINAINNAQNYLYITTPYLIIDNEVQTALVLAARMGVDVRIVTPGIPDKRSVFEVTRSFYRPLIEAGVKIYEYTPGFMHAKLLVTDDQIAVVGTCNFDFRSFFLHFECGAWMCGVDAVKDVRDDIEQTIAKSRAITHDTVQSVGLPRRLMRGILVAFAPML